MMNDKFLQNYKSEVLDLFKMHYRKMTAKNLSLEFESVLQSTMQELGILKYSYDETNFLKEWFIKIHHHLFFTEILNSEPFQEVIFHSNTEVQKITTEGKEIISIFIKNLSSLCNI